MERDSLGKYLTGPSVPTQQDLMRYQGNQRTQWNFSYHNSKIKDVHKSFEEGFEKRFLYQNGS